MLKKKPHHMRVAHMMRLVISNTFARPITRTSHIRLCIVKEKKMHYSNCVNVYFNESLLILVWLLKEGERYMIWDNNKSDIYTHTHTLASSHALHVCDEAFFLVVLFCSQKKKVFLFYIYFLFWKFNL